MEDGCGNDADRRCYIQTYTTMVGRGGCIETFRGDRGKDKELLITVKQRGERQAPGAQCGRLAYGRRAREDGRQVVPPTGFEPAPLNE